MNYQDLKRASDSAQQVCAPDEFPLRQRRLVHAIAAYLLARDAPKPAFDDDEDDDIAAIGFP